MYYKSLAIRACTWAHTCSAHTAIDTLKFLNQAAWFLEITLLACVHACVCVCVCACVHVSALEAMNN